LQLVSSLLFSEKMLPLIQELLAKQQMGPSALRPIGIVSAVLASGSYFVTYGMAVVALVCLDVLLKDSGRAQRLVEMAGLCFFSQVPYCLLMVVVAYLWSPEPIWVPPGASVEELRITVQEYREAMFAWGPLVASRIIGYYSLIWLVGLMSVSLKVVSRLSGRAVVFAGTILLALFVFVQLMTSRW
jgi:hypothetical protein